MIVSHIVHWLVHYELEKQFEIVRDTTEAIVGERPMHEIVRDLPPKYDSLIGGGAGVGLSGGQLLRFSIASVQLRNPTVLILGMFPFLFFSSLKLD